MAACCLLVEMPESLPASSAPSMGTNLCSRRKRGTLAVYNNPARCLTCWFIVLQQDQINDFCLRLVAVPMKTHRTATLCMEMECANGPAVRPSLEIFRHFSSKWRKFNVPKARMMSMHANHSVHI